MLSNNLRLAIRHLARKRIYSTIIILSLTTGFACSCLLVSFLISEQRTDSFHVNKDRIYEVTSDNPFGGSGRIHFTTVPTRDYLEQVHPGIENVCQLSQQPGSELVFDGNETAPLIAVAVDTSFFTLFSFPIVRGSKESLTQDAIMLTERKAKALFGAADVIGKTVNYRTNDTTRLLTITGLIGAPTENSHLKFDALIQHRAVETAVTSERPGGLTYLLLTKTQNSSDLAHLINSDSMRPTLMGHGNMQYFLEPLSDVYYNKSGTMTFRSRSETFINSRSEVFIWVGWIVCGLVLFMASFNFANLFLLSLQERRKEAGIKKTLGISLWEMIKSSATESLIYIGVSFALSLMLAYYLVPLFNETLRASLTFSYFSNFYVLAVVTGIVFLLAIIVVLISTAQQRKVPAVSMMRNTSSKVQFSKVLFTVQFFIAITMSICAVTIIRQMNYLESASLGFNRNLLQLKAPWQGSAEFLPQLKNRIVQISGVQNATVTKGNPISGNMVTRYELEDGKFYSPYIFSGDDDYLKTLDLQLIAGQLTDNGRLVNETLVKHFAMKDPVGAKIPGSKEIISGVVKDFTCGSFKNEIPPVIISKIDFGNVLLVDYSGTTLTSLLPEIKKAGKEIFPNQDLVYNVIQEDLMKKYSEEEQFYKIVISFSIVSMVISCFGLFALSWAVIQSRTREMGIRKILGAGMSDVLGLLTASFALRLAIAFILAAPLGYYLMSLWLAAFVNRVAIDAWVFVASGAFVVVVAVATLGVQTVRAAVKSPLNEIRE